MCVKGYIGRDKRFLLSNSYCNSEYFHCDYIEEFDSTTSYRVTLNLLLTVDISKLVWIISRGLMYLVLFYSVYVMCLALENWLFLTKNGSLLAIFPSSTSYQTVLSSSSSSIWFPIFACICEFVCAVYELLAIKYNESQPRGRSLCIKLFIIIP